MLAKTGFVEGISRDMQKKVDSLIPEKFHTTISKALEVGIKSILRGINLIPLNKEKLVKARRRNLIDIDENIAKIIKKYKKIAAASGAGLGAGGFLSLALDYPTLISLQLKMLQEIAQTFGHNIKKQEERIFLLKIFLLAFSGDSSRRKTYLEIINWQPTNRETTDFENSINWQELYREYKEKVEFKKTLQIVPGLGALVGAWSNYSLIEELGETAQNCYRLRFFNYY